MKKKDVLLTFGITNNYVDKLANVLIGLKRHNSAFWDDIVVFHNGVSEENQKKIKKIINCDFVEVTKDDFIRNINKEAMDLYSIAMFFRYECFNYLDRYRKVIWSDVDILIQNDISHICDYCEGKEMAATIALEQYKVINNFEDIVQGYNMFVPMYNSGLLVFSDALLQYGDLSSWCYNKTIEVAPLLKWPDQGIINLMIQEFDISVDAINLDYYHCHPSFIELGKKAGIVHAHGTRKFWNDDEYNVSYPEWNENNKVWGCIVAEEMKKPLVSVVMSVYKRYDFLDECLNSLFNQTLQEFEIIIVIEKSDNQKEIEKFIESYNDDRIKVICNQERLGFPASLNIAIKHSKGKYIARMDDDDICVLTRLEEEANYLEKHEDIGMVSSNAEFFMNASGKWFEGPLKSEEIEAELLVGCPICHPSVMFRREEFNKYNLSYNSEYFSEDFELWSQMIKHMKMYRLDKVLLKYRASNTSLTGSSNNEMKIAMSTKNTISHQLKDNLGLYFDDNQLSMVQKRRDILNTCGYYESVLKLKREVINTILDANRIKKYYNQDLLKKALGYNLYFPNVVLSNGSQSILKRSVKCVLRPFYKLSKRITNRLLGDLNERIGILYEANAYKLNVMEEKMKKLEEETGELEKASFNILEKENQVLEHLESMVSNNFKSSSTSEDKKAFLENEVYLGEKRVFSNRELDNFVITVNDNGKDNKVYLNPVKGEGKVFINLCGNNNVFKIGQENLIKNDILVEYWSCFPDIYPEGVSIEIGNNNVFNGEKIKFISPIEKSKKIKIGSFNLFAGYITFRGRNDHMIFNVDSKKRENNDKEIILKDEIWICDSVIFLPGTDVNSKNVIGEHSLVNKSFEKNNTLIAGMPAKVKKENIMWNINLDDTYKDAKYPIDIEKL